MEKKRKLLAIIDGKSVFYRGYYAMPNLSTRDGMPTGGVYGFTSMSVELIKRLKPDYVAVAWDKPKTNIRSRKAIYPEYKAGRKPAPPDFYEQIPILRELLDGFGWPFYELDDYEADDILGTLAVQANQQGIDVALITSDLDSLQLIGEHTKVYALKKGLSNIDEFDIPAFEAKYGISVEQFLDLKSLMGDSSDNLPGVAGVGQKTATTLLQNYMTLDGIYENLDNIKDSVRQKLEAGRESAYMTKQVAEIWCDAPLKLDLESMDVKKYDPVKLKELLTQLEFRGLLNRLRAELTDIDSSDDNPENSQPKRPKRDIKTIAITQISDLQGPSLEMEEIVIDFRDEWLILADTKTAYVIEITRLKATKDKKFVQDLLDKSKLVVGYDVKEIMHQLDKYDLQINSNVFDVRLAAYLLNSLIRDKSLEALSGGPVDEVNIADVVATVWDLYDTQQVEFKKLPKLSRLAKQIEFPMIKILFMMERCGISLDAKVLSKLSDKLSQQLDKITAEIYSQVGHEFNLNSPGQLSEILFTELELPTTGIKKGKTGYSTGAKELAKLQPLHPMIELIIEYREISKLLSTYVQPLPKLVTHDGRLHTTFVQDVVPTGRLSSNDPNLQNIPVRSKYGKEIRKAFVAGRGRTFINADYSQFELRLAALLSDDKAVMKMFENDEDVHQRTAAEVYGIELYEVTKNQRRAAKAVNFGIMYGQGPHALAEGTGMSFKEAREFIDKYFEIRSRLRDLIDKIRAQAKDDGYVETIMGRRRPTPDVQSSNYMVREAAYRAAVNMPIQGSAADIMKLAMVKLQSRFNELNSQDRSLEAQQILQIHDSILVECSEKRADEIAGIIKETMENAYPELGIKLKVDVAIGKNWGEL